MSLELTRVAVEDKTRELTLVNFNIEHFYTLE